MNKITRRRVIVGGAAAAGLSLAGIAAFIVRLPLEMRLKRFLRSRLSYLHISPDVIDAFARDFVADKNNRLRQVLVVPYAPPKAAYKLPSIRNWLQARETFERRVLARFLFSTDFFREGADVKRPVKYWRYSDPYKLGCGNPFARLS